MPGIEVEGEGVEVDLPSSALPSPSQRIGSQSLHDIHEMGVVFPGASIRVLPLAEYGRLLRQVEHRHEKSFE